MRRRAFLKTAAVGMPLLNLGCAGFGLGASEVRITPIVYGRFDLPCSWLFAGADPKKTYPIVLAFHLIEFDGRIVLADVGCDRFELDGRGAHDFVRPAEALRRHGVDPRAVEAVLISHHHSDHIGAIASFPNARVYIQADEAGLAKDLPVGRDVVTFGQSLEIYGGRMKLQRVGGHTVGSSVVLIADCPRGRTAVIAGDAVYSRENLRRRVPTATTQNRRESEAFLETYLHDCYRILLCHDLG